MFESCADQRSQPRVALFLCNQEQETAAKISREESAWEKKEVENQFSLKEKCVCVCVSFNNNNKSEGKRKSFSSFQRKTRFKRGEKNGNALESEE